MEYIRKQLYITPYQDQAIKLLAKRQGITEAELIRRAIDLFLAQQGLNLTEDPFSEIIGMFEGPSEVNHNDIYRQN